MSIKIGTVEATERIPDEALLFTRDARTRRTINVYVSAQGVEFVAAPCVLTADQALEVSTLLVRGAFLVAKGITSGGPVAERPGPAIFPCGCSRLKVLAGKCDSYDQDGKPVRPFAGKCEGR